MIDFCLAEGFYLFTVVQLVQSNDQKKFYRERTLHSGLRLLLAIVHMRRRTNIEEMARNSKEFTAQISHLKQLNYLLLTKIKQYEIVQPLEVLVFCQIRDFLCEFESLLIFKSEAVGNESFDKNDSGDLLQA